MGHLVNNNREYNLLQRRLDHCLEGAPASPVFMNILKMLFSVSEANLARQIPLRPTPISVISRKTGIPMDELEGKINEMAGRGLVFDAWYKGRRYVVLAPVVIGFFEFTFMRTRDDLPMKDLARLFDDYMLKDDRFARSVFSGNTQIGRSLAREEALPDDNCAEILDWERASHIIKTAGRVGVSLCACRHKALHLEKACDKPRQTCLTLNNGAEILIKNGLAEEISRSRAMEILEQCKNHGLAQTADNVQRSVGYICNCCGCCCGMFKAMKTFNIDKAIVSSNWIMHIDTGKCTGCGACARACPLGAIVIHGDADGNKTASCDEDLCLGCGVCHGACKFGSITMKSRPRRVFTPETTFDRIIIMALERGKLSNYIFDDPSRLSHRALGRIISIIEKSPPVRNILALQSVRSVFLNTIVSRLNKMTEG